MPSPHGGRALPSALVGCAAVPAKRRGAPMPGAAGDGSIASSRSSSCSAASPTASCSGVGSVVVRWRCVSRPGERKIFAKGFDLCFDDQRRSSIEVPSPTTPAMAPATGELRTPSLRCSRLPATVKSSNGPTRFDPQRSCSLVADASSRPLPSPLGFPAPDELVLGAVIGGDGRVLEHQHRGDERGQRGARLFG